MRTRFLPLLPGLALLTASCGLPSPAEAPGGERNVVSAKQMIEVSAQTVYDALERLRPDWLTTRGPSSLTDSMPDGPSVFIGGNRVGDADFLRDISADAVDQVRYYEAGAAGVRFGRGHPRGVIEVFMKSGI